MSADPREELVATELRRSEEALRAAAALVELGLHADAVSRAYYAAFHALRALLLSRGLEPRSHSGAIHLLNVEFVRTGALPSSINRLLAGLQRSRELADYDAAVEFSADDAEHAIADARAIVDSARALLAPAPDRADGA